MVETSIAVTSYQFCRVGIAHQALFKPSSETFNYCIAALITLEAIS